MKAKYRETIKQGKLLNVKLSEYFRNDFNMQNLIDNPKKELAKIEAILKSAKKVNLKELAAAEQEQLKNSSEEFEVGAPTLWEEIDRKLIKIRGDLEESRRRLNEQNA